MRTQRLELRLTDEERTIDQAAAAAVGESLSDFFRRAAANRAADILADQRTIALTEDEATRFLDALNRRRPHCRAPRESPRQDVSAPPPATERYDPARHDASKFESGNEALDRWLHRYAGQSERRDAARTFVIADAGVVIGFYALLAGELDHHQATEQTRKGMSRHYPIPVAILARLAVDHRHQGSARPYSATRCEGSRWRPSSSPSAP